MSELPTQIVLMSRAEANRRARKIVTDHLEALGIDASGRLTVQERNLMRVIADSIQRARAGL